MLEMTTVLATKISAWNFRLWNLYEVTTLDLTFGIGMFNGVHTDDKVVNGIYLLFGALLFSIIAVMRDLYSTRETPLLT